MGDVETEERGPSLGGGSRSPQACPVLAGSNVLRRLEWGIQRIPKSRDYPRLQQSLLCVDRGVDGTPSPGDRQ